MLTPRINVLVLDDEPSCAKTMRLLLEDRGYQVQSFTDPLLAIVAAESKTFQIAFVNLRMPTLDGYEVVERLKVIDKRIYAIIHTAFPGSNVRIAAMRVAPDDFLPVPFREKELLAAAERGIQRLGLAYVSEAESDRIVGQRVRDARVDRDLTLDDVSNRSGLASSQLQELEEGMVTPSIAVLARIAGALRLRIADLLWGL